jgi:hypothetical protein
MSIIKQQIEIPSAAGQSSWLVTLAAMLVASLSTSHGQADTPLGFISSNSTSAYTLNSLDFEFAAATLAVNNTIDFLNARDELVTGTRSLSDNSGDLSGQRAEIQFGLGSMFSVFYHQQSQDLTVKFSPVSSVDLEDSDTALKTMSKAYGLKWNFYEAGRSGDDSPWSAASLELTRVENKTDDFRSRLSRVQLGNTQITFNPAQGIQVDNMEDEGWLARLIYTRPLGSSIVASAWGGYASYEASSGTSSEIDSATIRSAFQQSFLVDETQYLMGLSLNWQITARLPLQLSYEYIKVDNRDLEIIRNPSSVILPSFLRQTNLSDVDDNHTLSGSLSYWLTPRLNLGLHGKLFSSQFLGIMPHFNNPLSGGLADTAYGYAGVQVGYRL